MTKVKWRLMVSVLLIFVALFSIPNVNGFAFMAAVTGNLSSLIMLMQLYST